MTTIIKVIGPGSTINYEMEVIKRALEAEGLVVQVENDYPFELSCSRKDNITPATSEEWTQFREQLKQDRRLENWIEHRRELTKRWNNDGKPTIVKLVAEHEPWGG